MNKIKILINSMRNFVALYPRYCAFLLISVMISSYNLSRVHAPFYYDSSAYWDLKNLFVRDGEFFLTNYNSALRGYVLPLLYYFVSLLADWVNVSDVVALEIFMAIFYSLGISFLIPSFIERAFHRQGAFLDIMLFALFLFLFWRGYFFYPLSDFPALFCFIASINLLFANGRKQLVKILLSGICCGATILMRPSYQIILIPIIVWMILRDIKLNKFIFNKIVVRLLIFMVGLLIMFAPQVMINVKNFKIYSPFVQTQVVYGESLFVKQLSWGIEIQKFEGNIGNIYPVAPIYFLDRHGENILLLHGYKSEARTVAGQIGPDQPLSLKKYIQLVFNAPLDFLLIYMRHLFNGLDIVTPTPYIYNVFQNAILLRFLNYTVLFSSVVYLWRQGFSNNNGFNVFLIFILALPSLMAIPGAMEVRFMLPAFFMVYGIVSYFAMPQLIGSLRQHANIDLTKGFKYALSYIVFLLVCFTLSANTFMGLEFGYYILHGG